LLLHPLSILFPYTTLFRSLPNICFAEGMTSYLYAHKVRIFDYPRFAQPFREELRLNAERLAAESGITIEHIRKKNIRKEDLVQADRKSTRLNSSHQIISYA